MPDAVYCPWCGLKSRDTYAIQLHIEEQHTEDSPFRVRRTSPVRPHRSEQSSVVSDGRSELSERWIKCTRRGCGERMPNSEFDQHLDMHDAVAPAKDDRRRQPAPRVANGSSYGRPQVESEKAASHVSSSPSTKSAGSKKSGSSKAPPSSVSSVSSSARPKDALKERQNGRLGKKELGPYAFEKAMPPKVRRALENASKPSYECRIGPTGRVQREGIVYNQTPRPIPMLADLSALDPTVETAYFCHKSVKHVHKLMVDGNFCGYWNIQMLLSYRLAKVEDPAHGVLPLPNVIEIQDTIEAAWDAGTCSFGRTETGGIRNTRKWIGTHEAAAYFLHLGHPVTALSFKTPANSKAPPAHVQLLDYVEAYFISGLEGAATVGSSRITEQPPIYFQRPGHSTTIVGMERRQGGERVLLVFDPSFDVNEAMRELADSRVGRGKIESVMSVFRQDATRLSDWKEYEILM
ncbi:hypothetical protein Q7P37_005265 [Cladosporium fusiforme]